MATPQAKWTADKLVRSKGTGSSMVYQELRRRIISLEMRPGEDIDEQMLVDELAISRTPLREAMIRLASEGLITLLPNRGARVASFELPQLQEHLEAFELAQRAVTRLAALRRTSRDLEIIKRFVEAFEEARSRDDSDAMLELNWELHRAIGRACGNRVLEKIYSTLLTESQRLARLAMSYEAFDSDEGYTAHLDNIVREHREMLEALIDRNADRADQLGHSHTNLARKRTGDFIASSGISALALDSFGAPLIR
jgi:DNA-binding GntR family transcriptional regulator